jgi:hypothetical protein
MKVIAFLTDCAAVDRIINHLKLSFVADGPLPLQAAYQEVLMAAEAGRLTPERVQPKVEFFGLSARGPAGDDGGGDHPSEDDEQREPLD